MTVDVTDRGQDGSWIQRTVDKTYRGHSGKCMQRVMHSLGRVHSELCIEQHLRGRQRSMVHDSHCAHELDESWAGSWNMSE